MAGKGKGGDNGKANNSGAKGKGKDAAAAKGKGDAADAGRAAKACQQINVRHILCEKHGRKEEALAKLKEGAKFDEVAREFSEDKARAGGALGWKKRGELEAAFEAVAFELAESTTAKPTLGEAKTSHGYHILMVEGRK